MSNSENHQQSLHERITCLSAAALMAIGALVLADDALGHLQAAHQTSVEQTQSQEHGSAERDGIAAGVLALVATYVAIPGRRREQ